VRTRHPPRRFRLVSRVLFIYLFISIKSHSSDVVFTGILADFCYIVHLPLLGFGVNRVPDFLGFFFSFFWADFQLCQLDDLSEHISSRGEPVIRTGSRVSPGGYVPAAHSRPLNPAKAAKAGSGLWP
jgi:hypothetical protein